MTSFIFILPEFIKHSMRCQTIQTFKPFSPEVGDTLRGTAASTKAESTQITDMGLSEIIVSSEGCFSDLLWLAFHTVSPKNATYH